MTEYLLEIGVYALLAFGIGMAIDTVQTRKNRQKFNKQLPLNYSPIEDTRHEEQEHDRIAVS